MNNHFLKYSIEILFLLSGFLIRCANPDKVPDKPNIVFFVVDDLGKHDLSCTGSNYYETPNIDLIHDKGMVFTNGYATCQVCSPSRASLMTGKFPARHGITDYIGAKSGEDWRELGRHTKLLPADYLHNLPHEDITLPEALKEYGYSTFFAGKWHLGGKGSYPEDHGFDVNKGGYEAGGPYSGGYFSPFNNPKMKDYPDEKGMSLSMKLANEIVSFIKENKSHPFFAYLCFYAVHAPIQTTHDKWMKFRDKVEMQEVAESGFRMERRLPIRIHQDNPVYAGLISLMDDAVGHVLQTLEDLDLSEKTIVIFTSDNGGVASGDNFSTSNTPLRGGKGYQWEGGLRVPYFIYVPWMDQNGVGCDIPVTGADFYPTILDLVHAELKPGQHRDGVSLLPVLEGTTIPERPLYWHYPHYGNQGGDPSSISRQGDWKLIHYHENNKVELYDLKNDPGERINLEKQHPKLAEKLDKKLMDWLHSLNVKFPDPDPEYDPELEKIYRNSIVNDLWPHLEKQRKEMFRKNWEPNDDWWGSLVPED